VASTACSFHVGEKKNTANTLRDWTN